MEQAAAARWSRHWQPGSSNSLMEQAAAEADVPAFGMACLVRTCCTDIA